MKTYPDEDGYELWLRYRALPSMELVADYRRLLSGLQVFDSPVDRTDTDGSALSPTLAVAARELTNAIPALLALPPWETPALAKVPLTGGLVLCVGHTPPSAFEGLRATSSGRALSDVVAEATPALGDEGFTIEAYDGRARGVAISASSARGVLYGSFALLRLLQTHTPIENLSLRSVPRVRQRMLDHWDNLDRSVERGYAGCSLWDWQLLPDYRAPRYTDYARALASIGINCTVLTNVNANARILTQEFLVKVAALAEVFRPYGIRVFLTARFSAPVELGELSTADPLEPSVRAWWSAKCDEIYALIPDFGGFVVKANSEGQPGPQDYGRDHADGANLLADALGSERGIVVWRAFVYDHEVPEDRAKQANTEFEPLDGRFRANALVQVKNGPIDFQPREPFHPLFGKMPNTPLVLEFQLTQEYLGFATHLVYLGTLFEEVLRSDTRCIGPGSTVGRVIDRSIEGHSTSGIAAVANIGSERNWCGHPFAQANWYAFGRLAWDHTLSARSIAEEWLRMTFNNDARFVERALGLMMASREHCVEYMTPLGLHHIMAWSHHYGPGPWIDTGRPDWTSVYYHRADEQGIGFDRTPTGSGATRQYAPEVAARFENLESCPEELLLWFHHLPWDHPMRSHRTLWDELCYRYHRGADAVRAMIAAWAELEPYVDAARFEHVRALFAIQAKEARWWRDACLLYFQTFSKRPIPAELEQPTETLLHYRSIQHHYVPGN